VAVFLCQQYTPIQFNPGRTMQLAIGKLKAAKETEVSLPVVCETALNKDGEQCEVYVAPVVAHMRQDIDNIIF